MMIWAVQISLVVAVVLGEEAEAKALEAVGVAAAPETPLPAVPVQVPIRAPVLAAS
jgi:hypothetical protein